MSSPYSSPVSGIGEGCKGHDGDRDEPDRADGDAAARAARGQRKPEERQRRNEEPGAWALSAPGQVVRGVVREERERDRPADERLGPPPGAPEERQAGESDERDRLTTTRPFSEKRSESADCGSGSPTP